MLRWDLAEQRKIAEEQRQVPRCPVLFLLQHVFFAGHFFRFVAYCIVLDSVPRRLILVVINALLKQRPAGV